MKPYYRILRIGGGREPKVKHATLKEAEAEALRLAGQHPGSAFEILQCLAVAQTSQPALFWNDGCAPAAPVVVEPALYPTTPLPEGFDRWECRGFGWEPGREIACYTVRFFNDQYWAIPISGRRPDGQEDYEYWEAVVEQPTYRMLEAGEVIEEGDEFRSRKFSDWDTPRELHPWKPVPDPALGAKLFASNVGHYRRLIKP
jgi:hypothetical protein